jgi:hypothetical protein
MKLKLTKLLKGALIAGLGAGLTYMAEGLQGIDFGEWTPIVVAGFAVFVNAIRQTFRHTEDFDRGYQAGYLDREIVDGFHDEVSN